MDGTLVIFVGEAKNLPNIRKLEKQSPFCCLRFNKQDKKSDAVIRGGQRPQWNFEAHYENVDEETNAILKISIFDKTKKGSHLICDAEIDCSPVFKKKHKFDGWHDLSYAKRRAGKIYMEMTFYPRYMKPQEVNSPASIAACSFHESRPLPRIPNMSEGDETDITTSFAEHPIEYEKAQQLPKSNKLVKNPTQFSYSSQDAQIKQFINNDYMNTADVQLRNPSNPGDFARSIPLIDPLELARTSLSSRESIPDFRDSLYSQNSFGISKVAQNDDFITRAFENLSISANSEKIEKKPILGESFNISERAIEQPHSPLNPYRSTFSHSDERSLVRAPKEYNTEEPANKTTDLMRISALLPSLPDHQTFSQSERLRCSMGSSVSSSNQRDSIFSTSIQSSLSSLPRRSLHHSSVDSPERFFPKFFLSSNSPNRVDDNVSIESISFQESISSLQFRKVAQDPENYINNPLQESILSKNYKPEEQKSRKEEVKELSEEFLPSVSDDMQKLKDPYAVSVFHDFSNDKLANEIIQENEQSKNPYEDLSFDPDEQENIDITISRDIGDLTFVNINDNNEYRNQRNNSMVVNNNFVSENSTDEIFDALPYAPYNQHTSLTCVLNDEPQFEVNALDQQRNFKNDAYGKNWSAVDDSYDNFAECTHEYDTFINKAKHDNSYTGHSDNDTKDIFAVSTSTFYKRKDPEMREKKEQSLTQKGLFADLQPTSWNDAKIDKAPIKSFNKKRLSKIKY